MSARTCQSPLTSESLIAYWLGELAPADEARAEEHYLGCAQCGHRLEELAALASGVRDLARKSGVSMIVNDEFVRKLTEDGLRVREYRVPRNGSVSCTATPEDDFVVGRLEAPLAGVQRVDMLTVDAEGNTERRQPDVPFAADSGGVVFSPSIDWLRALPACTFRVRLLAVDENGERTLGDYAFNHTPCAS
jgi:hypothetical protein